MSNYLCLSYAYRVTMQADPGSRTCALSSCVHATTRRSPCGGDYSNTLNLELTFCWWTVCSCFNDIKGMFTRIYDNLRPGGWAEFQDAVFEPVGEDAAADDFVRNSTYAHYFQKLCDGGLAHGRDFRAAYHFKDWMLEAGFVDVVKVTILVPLNAWPLNSEDKMIGNWFCTNVLKFLDGSSKLLEAGGVPRDQVPGFLDQVKDNLTDLRLRGYTEREFINLVPPKKNDLQPRKAFFSSSCPSGGDAAKLVSDYVYYGHKPGGPDVVANNTIQPTAEDISTRHVKISPPQHPMHWR